MWSRLRLYAWVDGCVWYVTAGCLQKRQNKAMRVTTNGNERERQTDGRRTHLLAEELEADLRAGREVAQLHRVARPVLFVGVA